MLLKGQGAIELLVLLTVIAGAGVMIYVSSQTNLGEFRRALIISQAKAAVNDLASAASEVYSEGVGAKRRVYIVMPEGAIPERVFVNNTMINVGVRIDSTTTDINAQTTMKLVQGADFQTTPGSYWVTVTAKEGYVLIGTSYLDVSPSSLSVEMQPSNSTTRVVKFTNLGNSPLSVTLSPQWSDNETVELMLNTTAFVLASSGDAATAYLLVSLQTYSNTPLRLYSGEITASTNASETADISLNVNVVGTQLPTGVSQILIETFKESSYSTPTTNFTVPTMVNITGSDWTPGTVTIDVRNPSASSVNGYPTQAIANSSGGFLHQFNPAGISSGQYSVIVNQSTTNSTTYFNITVCS